MINYLCAIKCTYVNESLHLYTEVEGNKYLISETDKISRQLGKYPSFFNQL